MPQPSLGKSRGSCQKRSSREMGGRRSQRAGITVGAKNHRRGPQEKCCNWTSGGGGRRAPGESWVTLIFPEKYRLRYSTSPRERASSGFLKHKPPWGNQSLPLERRTHLIYTIMEIKPPQHAQEAISTKAERAVPGAKLTTISSSE